MDIEAPKNPIAAKVSEASFPFIPRSSPLLYRCDNGIRMDAKASPPTSGEELPPIAEVVAADWLPVSRGVAMTMHSAQLGLSPYVRFRALSRISAGDRRPRRR